MYKLFLILCMLGTDCKEIDHTEYIESPIVFETVADCQNYPYTGLLDSVLLDGWGCSHKAWGLVCINEKYDPKNPDLRILLPPRRPHWIELMSQKHHQAPHCWLYLNPHPQT